MRRILGYILSPIFWFFFGILLLVFHPIQVITNKIWGYKVRKRVVDFMNILLIKNMYFLGSRVKLQGQDTLPINRPLIIISNHQSTFDISPIIWLFKKHHPKFISKIELGKGIPSISYNLKHGGSALIDRKNKSQSIKEIITLGRHIEKENYAACIFPEGTRSRNGQLKKFQSAGVATLLRMAPSALVVPFAIDGNYKILENGYFPLRVGVPLVYTMLDPIEPKGKDAEEVVELAEKAIRTCLNQGAES